MRPEDLPYRPNVGAVLFNRAGRVFVARRANFPNAEGPAGGWQLPQGGIDEAEDPRVAIFRELGEEIGTSQAEIIAAIRPAARTDWQSLGRQVSRPAAALVRAALHRRRCRYPARS
jgi:8-oxo-dGTP pyrophosphatase MutT (NUDIX family)